MQQQTTAPRAQLRRRQANRPELTPGMITTAVSAGVVLVLISLTFVADWLRTPELALLGTESLMSPNGDQDHDFTTVTYQLSDAADVTAQVFAPRGGLVRTLFVEAPQTAGQHTITWDGLSEIGQAVSDGQYRLEITARGTVRSSSQSANLTVDLTPPNLQIANVDDGLRVREGAITVQGVTEPGAAVWVVGNPQPVSVDGQGSFAFLFRLVEGENVMELRAIDPAGNTTSAVRQINLVAQPPELDIVAPVDGSWTNQSLVAVSGQVSPNAELLINDQPVAVSAAGAFNHSVSLTEGDHVIRLTATDDVGNITGAEVFVHVKSAPPLLNLNVEEGQALSDPVLQLTGQTEPGAFVQVNGQAVPVSQGGAFQISLQLFEGSNVLDVLARDQAGNQSNILRQVRYLPGGSPQGSSLETLADNMAVLPALTLPVLAIGGIILAFFLLRQRGVTMNVSVDRHDFSPGLPGEGKAMMIWLDVNRDTRISLDVLDQNGYPVATILRDRRRTARRHTFTWDGYDDYGRPAAPGEYLIQAEAGINPVKVTTGVNIQVEHDVLVHGRPGGRSLRTGVAQPARRHR
jgi:flagellar hook assembly protein FlgD